MMLESVITAKAQTTLPKGVRTALGVSAGDRLAYVIERDRAIIMKAPAEPEDDPAVAAFLAFLERDIREHPEHVRELPQALLDRLNAALGDADIDLDAAIEGDVAI
jgi:antitoxin PrlF